MSFQKIPPGTRGPSGMPSTFFTRSMMRVMEQLHRFRGDRFQGMDLLYLTTVGARTGQKRQAALSRFHDGDGWLVVASMGGAIRHPAWYHNIAAHPDQVWAEVCAREFRVEVEQLEGAQREAAWKRITAEQPRYLEYAAKTDRLIPILKLRPVT
ncbi:nitroreductase/quinone reductase family protein [Nocardia mexicana]|uniref:Deazaflavin-dependent oxidoreductase (Nitroreductase family) n=1 Tax=Nocardia mexicana TaxID=279262 RepID=A0A370H3V5_9NOCA|nr:nitroreductase/quinone reductase family protein [Nocardia mexicana]RDI49902.1 deazaflavin-dependent oxidoreductase (nitroreductase family) [Nocardia mexicana]